LRTLSLYQLEAQLRDRFEVLAAADAPLARHRTLEATFDWSFALCSPAERMLWARLSVFAGSFDLDAATHVSAGDGLAVGEVAEALSGLVDKSVLTVEEHPAGRRYRLLETVRQYGLDRLRDGTAERGEAVLRRRHRDWYLDLAERFHADWFGPRQPQWTRRMRVEQANLRAALGYCLADPEQAPAGVRLAGALCYFWLGCGALHEGRHWLEPALAAEPRPTRDRLRALSAYIWLVNVQGDHTVAAASALRLLEQARQADEPVSVANAVSQLGYTFTMRGDLAAARPLLTEALSRYHQLNQPDLTLPANMTKVLLAIVLLLQGDPAQAADLCAQCQTVCRAHGDRWQLGHALSGAAHIATLLGDLAQAGAYARESLRVRSGLDDPLGVASSLEWLAWLAAADGDHQRAARLLGAADRQWRIVGQPSYGSPEWLRPHQQCETTTRQALGDATFEREFRRGTGLTLDKTITYALQHGDHRQLPR
jgi:non-specific serine/threonine protein kinase